MRYERTEQFFWAVEAKLMVDWHFGELHWLDVDLRKKLAETFPENQEERPRTMGIPGAPRRRMTPECWLIVSGLEDEGF